MPIKKRKAQDQTLIHPMLRQGRKTAILYRYIAATGEKGTTSWHLKQQPVFHPQLLADLINEGLVSKHDQPPSVSPYKLYTANKHAESLTQRVEIQIQVEVYENENGMIGVRCSPMDTLTNIVSDGALHIHSKTLKFKLPRRCESAGTKVFGKVKLDDEAELLDGIVIIKSSGDFKAPQVIEGVASRKVKSEAFSVRHTKLEGPAIRGLLTYSPSN